MELCPANGRLQPGFRFHPTNEELIMYYLKRKVMGKCFKPEIITEVDVYHFHPMDLRELSSLKKDLNWYFFCPRGKKYGCGERTNRATHSGYWKATGVDRVVSYMERPVGKIKTLVFHEGRPPKGKRTDWVMHEYKLDDTKLADQGVYQGSYVLCKIYKKSGWGPKNSEQYGAPFVEEEWEDNYEKLNGAQAVLVDNYNQSISAVTTSAVVNVCAPSTSEKLHTGVVSLISAVDQAPTPWGNAGASSSMHPLPYYDYGADQVVTPVSVSGTGNLISSADCFFPNNNNRNLLVQEAAPLLNADHDYDEIDRMLDRFVADDNAEVFGSLWDFNAMEEGEGGFDLTDLDAPL